MHGGLARGPRVPALAGTEYAGPHRVPEGPCPEKVPNGLNEWDLQIPFVGIDFQGPLDV